MLLTFTLSALLTILIFIMVPLYWKTYGPTNFLWISDIALFLTVIGLWIKSPLLISMAALGALLFEIAWNIDYFYQLATSKNLIGISFYMFESQYSKFLRAISLFHVVLPIIWIIYLRSWGYDVLALIYQTIAIWIILFATYLFTQPKDNINWVFLPKIKNWSRPSELAWLFILMIIVPIFFYVPLHYLFMNIFPIAIKHTAH